MRSVGKSVGFLSLGLDLAGQLIVQRPTADQPRRICGRRGDENCRDEPQPGDAQCLGGDVMAVVGYLHGTVPNDLGVRGRCDL